MSKFEQYIIEKTYDLNDDVDYIYNKSNMNKFIKALQEIDEDYIYDILRKTNSSDGYEFAIFPSTELKNNSSIEASEIKPVSIRVGIFDNGSFYRPNNNTLQISLNMPAFTFLRNQKFNKSSIEKFLNVQTPRFFNEFTSHSIKATIYHELVHWIDDVTHNSFISKKISKANEYNNIKGIIGKFNSVNHTNFEINSQIHAIKQVKRELSEKEFDNLTWEKLFQKKASLMANFKNFKNKNDYEIFIQNFIKRLHREDLLPSAMKKIPSWDDMNQILNTI
jgi:hypothetical protein